MSYTSKDVRVLEEIEHIRLNPGMYIGSTENPNHLVEEALDNALDEALAGHATIIAVIVNTKTNVYAVLDNGRGIPIDSDTPITISSKLFSGAKFQDKKSVYQISSGLHGVGLVAVNALSEYFNIEIYRDEKKALYNFIDAKLKCQKLEPFKNEKPFSTKIEFKPNKKYFDNLTPDIDRIRSRLTTASAEMPNNITFVLFIDENKEVIKRDLVTHFTEECLTKKDNIIITTLISEKKPEKFHVLFTYEEEGSAAPKIISSVNLLPVKLGGTHVNIFYDLIKDFFISKTKKYDMKFQPNDCLYKLRAYLILNLIEPKFSGQTKESLINTKSHFDKFIKDFKNQLETFAIQNEELLITYLERFNEYRAKLDSKKLVKDKTGGRRVSTKFTKLRDCVSRNGELYIVEGDSAGGSIINSRNPQLHAVLPLKGKSIPNATTKKDILKNKEISELIVALGTGVGPHFNISNLRYDKIICATDADHDGNHIACLVTMAFAILLPEVIKAGKYYLAQTPLFAINEGKIFIPIWNEEQLKKARKENRRIQRYKGLGEMNPDQLKVTLLESKTRNLMPIIYSDNINDLVKLFSQSSEKRNLVDEE